MNIHPQTNTLVALLYFAFLILVALAFLILVALG